jgi:hypothetical protein
MEFDARLFRIAVTLVALVASFYPSSPIAKFLYKWRGPIPRDGETHHRFSFRWSLFSLAWFVVLAAAELLVAAYVEDPFRGDAAWLAAIFALGLPLLAAVALAGAVLHAIRGAWQYAFHRNMRFDLAQERAVQQAIAADRPKTGPS